MSAPITTAETIKAALRQRVNSLAMLTPASLVMAREAFRAGRLVTAAQTWQDILEGDDTLGGVENKRRLAIAQKTWTIKKIKDADESEAAKHVAALEYFYNNATGVNAYDRDEAGEFEKIIFHMMSCVAMRYAAHHIVWKPTGAMVTTEDGVSVPAITAEFEFVPLCFFDRTSGRLRFQPQCYGGGEGQELKAGEWMVTTGPGLMLAAATIYQFKLLSLQDWVNFNQRYAQGKVIGCTPASKGTAEADAMEETVAAFAGDMEAVIYNYQGSGNDLPLQVIEPKGTASVDAFSTLVERQDRKFAALFRGADLSTMSAGAGDGTGASLQGDEADLIERADATMVGGTLRRVIDKLVIEHCFGPGVTPLAYIRIQGEEVEENEDATALIASAEFLAKHGARVSMSDIADRLNVNLAEDDDPDVLVPPAAPSPFGPMPLGTSNAQELTTAVQRTLADVAGVQSASLDPVRKQIAEAIAAIESGNGDDIAARLEAIAAGVPDLLTNELIADAAAPLESLLGSAAIEGARAGLRRKAELATA